MTLSAQTVALIVSIGSFVVPPVTSLLKRENWSAQLKQLIAALTSAAVAAIAIAWTDPHAFGLGFAYVAGLIYTASQLTYAGFKGSTAETKLAAVGSKRPLAPPAG